jgi:two-component system, NarL family, invasion response regulator UvrY
MRFLIVDDHAVMRSGVIRTLADAFPGAVFGEACDARHALSAARAEEWSLAIVDVSLPGRDGVELLKDLKEIQPALPVLVFSMFPEEQYALRALRAGAAGYLMKSSLSEELVKAVRKALSGGRYVSAAMAERLAEELAAPMNQAPHTLLSDREYQVFCLTAAGKMPKEMARELALSVNTVSTYRKRILVKMKMRTNSELTRYAIENKLLG